MKPRDGMNMNEFLNTLLSTENPVLPSPTAMRVALHLVWAIVLGSGTLLMAGKLARPYRLGLSFMVMAWTLVPGSASPAYWLGLAFQTPSLTSAVICLAWFLSCARREAGPGVSMVPALARRLTMLGAKSTLKDRWRQVLSEASRIDQKHLLTLEPGISENQTDEMRAKSLQLVIPRRLHETFRRGQRVWLIDLASFLELVRCRQDAL